MTDPALLTELKRLAAMAGLTQHIALRQGPHVAVPMTIGLCPPVVLLPAGTDDWPKDKLGAALRHELAHIQRRDWIFHIIAETACALYWFHPLIWLAARRLRVESEFACDDAVLTDGTPPPDYAEHLLEIARCLATPHSTQPRGAVAMAQRPQIEDRLGAILHSGLNRHGLTERGVAFGLSALFLVLIPMAALRATAPAVVNPAPLGTAGFRGRVVFEDGRPAAHVKVGAQIQNRINGGRTTEGRYSWADAITTSDGTYQLTGLATGPYNIMVVPLDPNSLRNNDPWVAAAIPGAQGTEGTTTQVADLVLTPGGIVAGRVIDTYEKPVSGLDVMSYGPHRPNSSAMVIGWRTGPDGRYHLRVAPGRSRIYVTYPDAGHLGHQEVTLNVGKGHTRTVNFQVAPQNALAS